MRVVIAPDSFKESLSAIKVAQHIEMGFRDIFPDWTYVALPIADGGEGTVEAMIAGGGGRIVTTSVSGPLGDAIDAGFGLTDDGRVAIVEMAAAAGLMLVPADRRDPIAATSFGVGQLIRAALDAGARHIVVGIGGSATNDGGAGMAQALGVRLLDEAGRDIGRGGGALAALARIDMSGLDPRLADCRIQVACDVDNVLTGPNGASAVFGPQKGADQRMVQALDAGLAHFARCVERDLGIDIARLPGGGAAGGLGAGLVAFLGAQLAPGLDLVAQVVGLEAKVAAADLVVTGEGRIDGQTIFGKAPVGVAQIAKRHGKPVIAIAGSLGAGSERVLDHGIDALFGTVPAPCSLEEAMRRAADTVRAVSRNVAAAIGIGAGLDIGPMR